jgi:hypothetical protein
MMSLLARSSHLAADATLGVMRFTTANRYGEASLTATRRGASANTRPTGRWASAMDELYHCIALARRREPTNAIAPAA